MLLLLYLISVSIYQLCLYIHIHVHHTLVTHLNRTFINFSNVLFESSNIFCVVLYLCLLKQLNEKLKTHKNKENVRNRKKKKLFYLHFWQMYNQNCLCRSFEWEFNLMDGYIENVNIFNVYVYMLDFLYDFFFCVFEFLRLLKR